MYTEEQVIKRIQQLDFSNEVNEPKVGSCMIHKRDAKYQITVYITLHDVLQQSHRERFTLTISAKNDNAAGKLLGVFEKKVKSVVNEKYNSKNSHDLVDTMRRYLEMKKSLNNLSP